MHMYKPGPDRLCDHLIGGEQRCARGFEDHLTEEPTQVFTRPVMDAPADDEGMARADAGERVGFWQRMVEQLLAPGVEVGFGPWPVRKYILGGVVGRAQMFRELEHLTEMGLAYSLCLYWHDDQYVGLLTWGEWYGYDLDTIRSVVLG